MRDQPVIFIIVVTDDPVAPVKFRTAHFVRKILAETAGKAVVAFVFAEFLVCGFEPGKVHAGSAASHASGHERGFLRADTFAAVVGTGFAGVVPVAGAVAAGGAA
jgi:hypothetical protein